MIRKKGRFKVDINYDGSINVKQGDCLSEYSVVIHGNPWKLHQFARRAISGKLEPIKNVNLIFAGELIYHIGSHNRYLNSFSTIRNNVTKRGLLPVGEKKKKIAIDLLKRKYHLKGRSIRIIEKVWDEFSYAEDVFNVLVEIAELMGRVGAKFFFCFQFSHIFMTAATMFSMWGKAINFNYRIYAHLSEAYTFIAWTFNDKYPKYSRTFLREEFIGQKIHHRDNISLEVFHEIWKKHQTQVLKNADKAVRDKGYSEKILKSWMKAEYDNCRQKMFRDLIIKKAELLKGDFPAAEIRTIKGLSKQYKYPE